MAPEHKATAARLLYPPPSPRRRPRGRQTQLASAALAAVALLAGGITAWAAFGQHQAGPRGQFAGRQTPAGHGASPAPRASATPSPSPPGPAPGGAATVMTMAPGLSQTPEAAQVDGFLVSYFTAINAHDYQQYERLLIAARRALLTAADFTRGYGAARTGTSPSTCRDRTAPC